MTTYTVLIKEKAIVHALTADSRLRLCDGCLRELDKLSACAACSQMKYCSRICQKKMWKLHKLECGIHRQHGRIPTTEFRLLIRLISVEDFATKKNIASLISHADLFSQSPAFLSYYRITLKSLAECLRDKLPISELEVFTLLCQMRINSLLISDRSGVTIAAGLFLKSARLDHSCTPNTEYVFQGNNIAVISFEQDMTVKKARISYVDCMTTTARRKAELSARYFFDCDCPLCLDTDRDERIDSLVCCSTALSAAMPLRQLQGTRKHLVTCSPSRLVRLCSSCQALYDDRVLADMTELCLSFYGKQLTREDARNAVILYSRIRGLSELDSSNQLTVSDPLAGCSDETSAAYYRLMNHTDSVYLANVCRATMFGASVENMEFLLTNLHERQSGQPMGRRIILQIMIACGVDLLNWQQCNLAFGHLTLGMDICSLLGLISRNISDADSVCGQMMEDIRRMSVSQPRDPSIASMFFRLVMLAEDKLKPFIDHQREISDILTNLKSCLKSS